MGRAVTGPDRRDAGWRARAWPVLRRALLVGILFLLLTYAWQWLLAQQRRVLEVGLFAAAERSAAGPAGVLPGVRGPA